MTSETQHLITSLQNGYLKATRAVKELTTRTQALEAALARVRHLCEHQAVIVTRGDGRDDQSVWWYAVDARAVEAAIDGTPE
jgi:hypothetical protein